ncbi:MAG: hypothetical protein U5R06_05165 [candidate division KSB1 bacterium]|nr:hypothetical protein [candidate division KSB1 bacterium]
MFNFLSWEDFAKIGLPFIVDNDHHVQFFPGSIQGKSEPEMKTERAINVMNNGSTMDTTFDFRSDAPLGTALDTWILSLQISSAFIGIILCRTV